MTTKTATERSALGRKILGNRGMGEFLLDQRAFLALFVLIIIFALMSDSFLTTSNLITMTKHVAYNALLAIGMLFVIITAGIDLSVGSTVGLSGVVAGALLQGWEITVLDVTLYPAEWVVIAISLAVGALVGFINGILVTRFNVAPSLASPGLL